MYFGRPLETRPRRSLSCLECQQRPRPVPGAVSARRTAELTKRTVELPCQADAPGLPLPSEANSTSRPIAGIWLVKLTSETQSLTEPTCPQSAATAHQCADLCVIRGESACRARSRFRASLHRWPRSAKLPLRESLRCGHVPAVAYALHAANDAQVADDRGTERGAGVAHGAPVVNAPC